MVFLTSCLAISRVVACTLALRAEFRGHFRSSRIRAFLIVEVDVALWIGIGMVQRNELEDLNLLPRLARGVPCGGDRYRTSCEDARRRAR